MDQQKMRDKHNRGKQKTKQVWDFNELMGYDGDKPDDSVALTYDSMEHVGEKAVLFVMYGDKQWIPKSQIIDVDSDQVVITRWLAHKIDQKY